MSKTYQRKQREGFIVSHDIAMSFDLLDAETLKEILCTATDYSIALCSSMDEPVPSFSQYPRSVQRIADKLCLNILNDAVSYKKKCDGYSENAKAGKQEQAEEDVPG